MYNDYFGLNEAPFSITPNPKYLYLGPRHQEALAHLSYGVIEGSGFVSLTGEVGTGKTTLCRQLLDSTPAEIDIALVFNPRLSALELVAAVCDELRVAYPKKRVSIKCLIDALNQHLLKTYAAGKRTVLIIDEAQNLSVEVLEQVRLLSNLETSQYKLLRIMLIGQPELRNILAKPELRQLNQRITARYHLRPLSLSETGVYIHHRLSVAGASSYALFMPAAIKAVYRFSAGTPRLINIICDRALTGAYATGKSVVDKKIATQAARETMDISTAGSRFASVHNMRLNAWLLSLVGLLLLVNLGLFGSMFMRDQTPEAPVSTALSSVAEPVTRRQHSVPVVAVQPPKPIQPITSIQPIQPIQRIQPIPPLKPLEKKAQPAAFSMALIAQGQLKQRPVFRHLFSIWQQDYARTTGKRFCAKAQSVGLQCLKKQGEWSLIRQFNRPVLIRLTASNDRSRYVLVQGFPSDQVSLFLDRSYVVDFDAISPYWDGVFVMLWRPPELTQTFIRQGQSGPDVFWLKRHLGVPTSETVDTARFDAALTRRVKQFQKEHFLKEDGVVGKQTRFHIAMFSPVTTDPLLQRTH